MYWKTYFWRGAHRFHQAAKLVQGARKGKNPWCLLSDSKFQMLEPRLEWLLGKGPQAYFEIWLLAYSVMLTLKSQSYFKAEEENVKCFINQKHSNVQDYLLQKRTLSNRATEGAVSSKPHSSSLSKNAAQWQSAVPRLDKELELPHQGTASFTEKALSGIKMFRSSPG